MKKVLIIKNIPHEEAGLLEEALLERGIKRDIVEMNDNTHLPPIDDYQAFFVLGGPASANDQTEKIKKQLSYIKEIIETNRPYLGICLGLQLMIKACGGKVIKYPPKEIGFYDDKMKKYQVTLTPQGQRDTVFIGLPQTFNVFQLHGETVEITNKMVRLGLGSHCPEQAVRYKNAYGLQFHLELTSGLFENLLKVDEDLKLLDTKILRYEFEQIQDEYLNTGTNFFNNFLTAFDL